MGETEYEALDKRQGKPSCGQSPASKAIIDQIRIIRNKFDDKKLSICLQVWTAVPSLFSALASGFSFWRYGNRAFFLQREAARLRARRVCLTGVTKRLAGRAHPYPFKQG